MFEDAHYPSIKFEKDFAFQFKYKINFRHANLEVANFILIAEKGRNFCNYQIEIVLLG